jgi:hypothetical protein
MAARHRLSIGGSRRRGADLVSLGFSVRQFQGVVQILEKVVECLEPD